MTTKIADSGLLLIDKPAGWTSHDVVAKTRRLAGTRRVGHAGTLDPMATGLLVLGVNGATKLLTFLVGADKTYLATIRLGASTITDDAEGEAVELASADAVNAVSDEDIAASISSLSGEIMQVPSSVSAIKVNGERSYAKVRAGEEVKLEARKVVVSRFDLLNSPRRLADADRVFIDLDVVVDCSSGTYIRALARDLGKSLGVGGHLTALRRTRVGAYRVEDAFSVESAPEHLPLISDADAVSGAFHLRLLSAQEEIDLRHGKRI
ncbi:MAG: tRNA pseudouridine(55) synthase TruB, partial [Actinomycetota bacterium]